MPSVSHCYECGNSREISCPRCNGWGKTEEDQSVNVGAYDIDCYECNGHGRIECPKCSVTTWSSDEQD
jgi:DnaJ-class molecular chaperone